MTISAVDGTGSPLVSASVTSMPSPNSAPRKWLSSASSGSGIPPANGRAGSTPSASTIGIGRPSAAHFARMTPRCCGGGIRQASRSRPAIIIRLTDQLVHEPSGAATMFIP